MSIAHHPGEELLLDYAGGAAGEAVTLIVAAHLAFCAACRRTVAQAEAVGGALLQDIAPMALTGGALEKTLARLDDTRLSRPAPSSDPLGAVLGFGLSQVRWRRMGPRLAYAPLLQRDGATARLLRGAPGTDVGSHGHRGQEYTLVLSGGFTDTTGSYGPGDFQSAAPDLQHNPVADPGEDCINLAVTTAPLVFDGLIQKIAGKLFGF